MERCVQYKEYLISFFKILTLIAFIILLPVLIDIFFKTGVHVGSNIRILTSTF